MPLTTLTDLRIIIGEDEQLLAIDLAQQLEALGAEVLETFGTLDALEQFMTSRMSEVNAAILDVELIGGSVLPLVPRLEASGVGVVICSGYQLHDRPAELTHIRWIGKPAHIDEIADALCRAVDARKDLQID